MTLPPVMVAIVRLESALRMRKRSRPRGGHVRARQRREGSAAWRARVGYLCRCCATDVMKTWHRLVRSHRLAAVPVLYCFYNREFSQTLCDDTIIPSLLSPRLRCNLLRLLRILFWISPCISVPHWFVPKFIFRSVTVQRLTVGQLFVSGEPFEA
jgi:hypothetical protein